MFLVRSISARIYWITVCVLFNHHLGGDGLKNITKHISASKPGDFIVGVLLSIHQQPQSGQLKVGQHQSLQCGEIREHYGIQRSEVVFQTIDEINADPYLLPDIKLGYQVLDTCWYAPIALRQTIELIRGSISGKDEKCTNVTSPSLSANGTLPKNTLIGIIGPGSSSIALQVQNLLQLFNIPQIGYSTTSRDLSDKSRFNSFLRVVPSDYYQAQVIIDIVRRFNWTYVSAVNTDENYGQSGIQAFRELAEKHGVCIAREDSVLSNADKSQFDEVLLNLDYDKLANVVVCFCEGMTVRGLLAAMKRLNMSDRFLIIGTDGWADRADVVAGYEREAIGSITVRIHSPYVTKFDPYYFSLSPFNNTRNPWFREFWEHKFNCDMPSKDLQKSITHFFDKKTCTGSERLSDKYKQEPKLSFVIKAIKTIAIALHRFKQDICGSKYIGPCPKMFPFNGTLFFNYLLNVSFHYGPDGDIVEFDVRGDPPGRYDIMNFQLNNDSYDYVKIGDWNNGTLQFSEPLQESPEGPVESVCSKPCKPGYYKSIQSGGQEKKCCWTCLACERYQYLFNETYCKDCPLGTYPNKKKTRCDDIPIDHIEWHDSEAVISMAFSIFGIIITLVTLFTFLRYNDTPVVKSSTRELCYIILIGMIISHASVFSILTKPTKEACALSRFLPGVSFSMIYASLFVKTNRIARILAGSKKSFPSKNLKFMSASMQVLLTGALIFIEISITGTMLIMEPAGIEHQYPTRRRVVLVCNTSPNGVLAPLGFVFVLIVFCTLYAWKTRSVPENFNEAKFIGFAMYTTCVIWIAFLPIYFGSESKIITHCICISLSATVTLILLFFPKLYIILIRPERNNRAFFTTTSKIRCHIGAQKVSSVSSSKMTNSSSSANEYYCGECSKRSSLDRIRVIRQSTGIQTSLDNVKEPLTFKDSNASDDTVIEDLLEIRDEHIASDNIDSNYSTIEGSKLDKDQRNKSVSNLVTNLEPLISQYRRHSPSALKSSVRSPKIRPTRDPPRIKFSDTVNRQYCPTPHPKRVALPPNRVFTSDSLTSSVEALEEPKRPPVKVSYSYYTAAGEQSAEKSHQAQHQQGYKLLCEECATKLKKKDDVDLTNKFRTAISEESLSTCSLAEPGNEYKIKSITIKIGKPYYL